MLKDKTHLTQRCWRRHPPLPWHSILFTKTHGETLPVTLSIWKRCTLLHNHFICKCEQSKPCSYLFSIFVMAARNCWAKFIPHTKRLSRTKVCNKSFGILCSLLAWLFPAYILLWSWFPKLIHFIPSFIHYTVSSLLWNEMLNEWMYNSQIISCFFNELEKTHDTYKVTEFQVRSSKLINKAVPGGTLWSVGFTEAVTT